MTAQTVFTALRVKFNVVLPNLSLKQNKSFQSSSSIYYSVDLCRNLPDYVFLVSPV